MSDEEKVGRFDRFSDEEMELLHVKRPAKLNRPDFGPALGHALLIMRHNKACQIYTRLRAEFRTERAKRQEEQMLLKIKHDEEFRAARAKRREERKRLKDSGNYRKKRGELYEELTEALAEVLLNEKIPLDVVNAETGEIIIPANRKITKTLLRRMSRVHQHLDIDPSPVRNKVREIISSFEPRFVAW
jgi:hypothetical protein